MNMLLKNICKLSVFAFLLAAVSCSTDDFGMGEDLRNNQGTIRISAYCNDMLETFIDPTETRTRADDKLNYEQKINSLHIFLFDANGEFLKGNYNNSQPYQYVENNFVELSLVGFDDLSNVRIVALANIDASDTNNKFDVLLPANENGDRIHLQGGIENGTRDSGRPYTIKNFKDLEEWVYAPRIRMEEENSDVSKLLPAGMPMYYMEPTLHPLDKQTGNLELLMTAMMARVDVSIQLDPKQYSLDEMLPELTITSYGVRNMPTTIKPFKIPAGEDYNNDEDWTNADIYTYKDENGKETSEIEFLPVKKEYINNKDKDNKKINFVYYTFENVRKPSQDYIDGKFTYPDNLPNDSVKQRWKSKIARTDEASAIILKGTYITDQNLTYNAQFTVYLGHNATDDFTVKRNHQYKNKILIKGLDYIRNSDDNAWTFDGRVNVVDENPIYLAIINERMIDAHATALPMDVWLMYREKGDGTSPVESGHNTTVTVTIPEECDWLRMAMVTRAEMEATNFAPGTGVEPYFTTDLFQRIDDRKTSYMMKNGTITTINNGYADRQCGKKVTFVSNDQLNNSRSRIYFYIDENVPDSDTPTNYGDRVATISIDYYDECDGTIDHRPRTLEIEQRALVKCEGKHPGGNVGTLWMEYYEEYLEHYDPLDKHDAPGEYYTDGLPWGKNGNYSNYTSVTVYNNYSEGYKMTKDVVENSNTANVNSVKLYNSSAPESAFHYCWGKNKRTDNNGTTALQSKTVTVNGTDWRGRPTSTKETHTYGWYMPGIRELESALTEHYSKFDPFQKYYYWSASAAKSGTYSEETTRARATKVIQTTPSVKYADSGKYEDKYNFEGHHGDYGRAPRNTPLRIRAFYRTPKK